MWATTQPCCGMGETDSSCRPMTWRRLPAKLHSSQPMPGYVRGSAHPHKSALVNLISIQWSIITKRSIRTSLRRNARGDKARPMSSLCRLEVERSRLREEIERISIDHFFNRGLMEAAGAHRPNEIGHIHR